jgi:hypothetical protein
MCGFEHVDSRCGHVSMVLLGHSVQFGFGYKLSHNTCLRWFPMYCVYRNFRVCVIGHLWSRDFSKIGWRVCGLFGHSMFICLCT